MTNRMLPCVFVFLFSVSSSFAGYLDGVKTDTSASFAITNGFVTEVITNNLGRADATNGFVLTTITNELGRADATNGFVLTTITNELGRADATNGFGLAIATNEFIKTIAEDLSPQLAANLDAQGNRITGMADATDTNDAVTLSQARDLTNGVAASAVDSMGLPSTNVIVLVNRNGVNQLITNAVNTLIDYTTARRNDDATFDLATSIGTFPVNGFYYLKNVVSIDSDNGVQITTIIRTNGVQAMISRLNPGAVSPPTTIVDMYGSFTTNDTFSFRILHASSGNQNYRGGLNESYGYMELIHTE